jgi:hypothetical protein
MEKAKALMRWAKIKGDMLRRVDPYLKKQEGVKPPEKPLSEVTQVEAQANLDRLYEQRNEPVELSAEARLTLFADLDSFAREVLR